MAVFSFVPSSEYEIHSSGGRRIVFNPSFEVLPLTPEEKAIDDKQHQSGKDSLGMMPTSDVTVSAADARAVLATLKSTFPEQASVLNDEKDLELEYVPAYNLGSIGEETWVVFNKKANREFLYVDARPEKTIPTFYFNAGLRPW
jgi:hypothetical protein